MQTIRILSHAVAQAASVIRAGGVLLSPTDTVYGLACDPFQQNAVNRVIELKGRALEKGFLLLVGSPQTVLRLALVPARFEKWAAQLWPGPVTFLLKARSGAPAEVVGKEGKIGFRQPRNAFLEALLLDLGIPLLSTSANRSGEALPSDLSGLEALFGGKVDLFLESGQPKAQPASTVVDLTTPEARILRAGAEVQRVKHVLESDTGFQPVMGE